MLKLLTPRDDGETFALYRYLPALVPAIIVCCLFILGAVAHTVLVKNLHAKTFIPFVIGCCMEAVGYGGRIWSHYVPTGLPGYIIQSLLILIAPALFAASIYIVLGRLIELIDGHSHSVIPPTWLTKLFVIGDCVSFFVQAMGGGIQAGGTLALLKMGEKIIVAGLFIQIFFFGFFVISAVIFNLRMNAVPTSLSQNAETPWRRHLYMLYITSGLILVRSAFRVVEYLMGNDGWILRHEFMLYIFDALLMLSVVVLFLLSHPGTLFADREDKGAESGIGFVTMSTRE